MIGSIIGDVVGSIYEVKEINAIKNNENKKRPYEERINILDKSVPLFNEGSCYTDDTALTCAIADAVINNEDYEKSLRRFGLRELSLGKDRFGRNAFSEGFIKWLKHKKDGDSFGNGSAMRISPIGFLYDDVETIKKEVYKATIPSHNNSEAIKGAEAVAITIFLARNGKTKEEIKEYIENNYYKLDFDLEYLQKNYRFSSKCSETVPQAIFCFLESNGFEDAIRKSISIGGDSDTIACIVGGISEAYYGIPTNLTKEIEKYLPFYLSLIVRQFYFKRIFLDFMNEDYRYSNKFKEYIKENLKILETYTDESIGCFEKRINGKLIDFKLVVPKLFNKKAVLTNIKEYYKAMDLYWELHENIKNDKKALKKLIKKKREE